MGLKSLPILNKSGISMYWLNVWDSVKLYKKYNSTYNLLEDIIYYFFIENLYYFCISNKLNMVVFSLKHIRKRNEIVYNNNNRKLYIGRIIFLKYQTWNIILVSYYSTNKKSISYKDNFNFKLKFLLKNILKNKIESIYPNDNYKYKFK